MTRNKGTPQKPTSATSDLTDPDQMLEAAAHVGEDYLDRLAAAAERRADVLAQLQAAAHLCDVYGAELEAVCGRAAELASLLRALGAPEQTIDAVLMGDRATWAAWLADRPAEDAP